MLFTVPVEKKRKETASKINMTKTGNKILVFAVILLDLKE